MRKFSRVNTILKKKKLPEISFNFYITVIDLSAIVKIDPNMRFGPYSKINFYGNPKIIIHVPPLINKPNISLPYIYQSNPNVCDIYVNLVY